MRRARIFAKVPPELDFPTGRARDPALLEGARDLREDAREARARAARFVFYEGPPTANGLPHNGHVLTRVIKDVFPRYKTMRGWTRAAQGGLGHARAARRGRGREGAPHPRQGGDRGVRRRALHQEVHRVGLPLHAGVGGADRARRLLGRPRATRTSPTTGRTSRACGGRCRSSSRRGSSTRGTRSSGGGRRAARRSARARSGRGTRRSTIRASTSRSRSSGEDEPVAPRVDDDAVDPAVEHVRGGATRRSTTLVARGEDGRALRRRQEASSRRSRRSSAALVGRARDEGRASSSGAAYRAAVRRCSRATCPRASRTCVWRVIAADFVTLDAGTGIVHIAPAFGEDDHEAHRSSSLRDRPTLPLFCAVKPDGTFVDALRALRRPLGQGLRQGDPARPQGRRASSSTPSSTATTTRSAGAPTATRSSSTRAPPGTSARRPSRTRRSRTTAPCTGCPSTSRRGASATSSRNNVDWALSRERWWGTPLNVWICDAGRRAQGGAPPASRRSRQRNPHAFDHFHARARAPTRALSEHLIVHKPWIDQVTFPCAHVRRDDAPRPGGHRLLVRLRLHALRPVGLPARGRLEGAVRAELPGRLHQRGHRPDARLVLLAAHDLDARLRPQPLPASVQDVHRARARRATRRARRRARARATTRRRRSSSTR